MGTVNINGKQYDTTTGLMVEDATPVQYIVDQVVDRSVEPSVEQIETHPEKVATPEVTRIKVKRRMSRQERIAQEIALEFGGAFEDDSTPEVAHVEREVEEVRSPEWVQEFAEAHEQLKEQAQATSPSWIANYVEGGEPVEIQPIGLETVAQNTATESQQPVAVSGWIQNFVDGGAPIEIEPIGLEKAARDRIKQMNAEVAAAPAAPEVASIRRAAPNLSRHQAKSMTLSRQFVKKPAAPSTAEQVAVRVAPKVSTHPLVHKFETFSPPVEAVKDKPRVRETEAPFRAVLTRGQEERLAQATPPAFQPQRHAARTTVEAPVPLSSSELKNALINEQLSAPIKQNLSRKELRAAAKLLKGTRRRFSAATITTAAFAIMLIGGFVTYTQMPNISVRVAAVRAGVDAKNPYTPSGYSIDGPVAYSPGTVTISYKSNGGGEGYSLTQTNSSWDDQTILNSLVTPSTSNYQTLQTDSGATVYRYGNNAVWNSDGVLYTLSGGGTLGDTQILRIANSI